MDWWSHMNVSTFTIVHTLSQVIILETVWSIYMLYQCYAIFKCYCTSLFLKCHQDTLSTFLYNVKINEVSFDMNTYLSVHYFKLEALIFI